MTTKRCEVSEAILCVTSAMTGLLLFVCPGWFFLFFLPLWAGLPLALGCASLGPWLMLHIDSALYGERP